jgi:hypothetical protein
MFKLLLLIVVGFLAYNWYLKPLLNPPAPHSPPPGPKNGPKKNDDDYADYEEIK